MPFILLFLMFGLFTFFFDTVIGIGKMTIKYFYIVIPILICLYFILQSAKN